MQERNFYTMVMDNKEIIKLLGMLSTCTLELRQVYIIVTTSVYLSELIYIESFSGLDGISRSLEALQIPLEKRA